MRDLTPDQVAATAAAAGLPMLLERLGARVDEVSLPSFPSIPPCIQPWRRAGGRGDERRGEDARHTSDGT